MKKLILLTALLPFYAFAGDTNCNDITDPAAKKECLTLQKQSEARNSFKNFGKNNQSPYQQSF